MANSKHDDYSPSEEFKSKLDRIDRPDKFAIFFCEAAKSQVAIKESLSDIVKEIISDNKGAKEKIKEIMKEIQRDNIRFIFTAISWIVSCAVSAVIAAVATYLIK